MIGHLEYVRNLQLDWHPNAYEIEENYDCC